MQKYEISGMSCAACSARVEKAVSGVKGVTKCSVNLLTNSMLIEGNAQNDAIIEAVKKAGYGASLIQSPQNQTTQPAQNVQSNFSAPNAQNSQNNSTKLEIKSKIIRLIFSILFLLPLMYFAMGQTMFNLPLFTAFKQNPISIALMQMLLAIIVMLINNKFFVNGTKSLIHFAPNMDSLIALGSGASFIYSVCVLFLMTFANANKQNAYLHQLYFESAAMILVLISVGKLLETISKGKTSDALNSLIKLAPKTANIEKNGEIIQIPVEELKIGDIFVVKPGENIATDGVIIEGNSTVDEANLTGESVPIDKKCNDFVKAATINITGFLKCRATHLSSDTTFSKIIQLVLDASASKAPIAKIADKVSGVFVPLVLIIALFTFFIWLMFGKDFAFALNKAISVLVISCPCALGLATPVAIMVASGMGAKNGILFKTAESLEQTGKIKTIAFDKTGTLTKGKPKITDIVPCTPFTKNELLSFAYSIEQKSEHPLAKAIVEHCKNAKIEKIEVTDFVNEAGSGLKAVLNNKSLFAGNFNFINSKTQIENNIKQQAEDFAKCGKTPLFFCYDKKLIGLIVLADVLKDESIEVIKALKKMGINIAMISGDNTKTANAIAKQAGIDNVFADVLPNQKSEIIKKLKQNTQNGKIAMVGDGVNDAPALTIADIGIAIGNGTDVAIDAADLVLVKNDLNSLVNAIKLSKKTLLNIKENLFWAFIFNILGIPLAAGAFCHFGIGITPMFGAAAMSLSSFIVVTNALRLNFVQFAKCKNINLSENLNTKGEFFMEKTMKIEGMMCAHCEARVKSTLEKLDGVSTALVSHQTGTAILKLNKEISNEKLKEIIEAEGYKVTEIA